MANRQAMIARIEEIEEISEAVGPAEPVAVQDPARVPPNKEHFDSLLNSGQQVPIRIESTPHTSLMEQVRDADHKVKALQEVASADQIAEQAKAVIAQMDQIKGQLSTPGAELKGSVSGLLKNKLAHIDESLKVALNRAGLEYTPGVEASNGSPSLMKPIERFLGFLTHGQHHLQRLANELQVMHLDGKEIAPSRLLGIQIKVGFVQQELEFFSNLLNKALESTKTIMNVQI